MSNLKDGLTNIHAMIEKITTTLQEKTLSDDQKNTLEGLLENAQLGQLQISESFADLLEQHKQMLGSSNASTNALNDANLVIQEITDNYEAALEKINIEKSTKIRQIQFNNYFSQMHSYNVNIMKILVVSSVLLMIVIYLYTKNIIPKTIYTFISVIIVVISFLILFSMVYSEFQRSSYNFNVFNW